MVDEVVSAGCTDGVPSANDSSLTGEGGLERRASTGESRTFSSDRSRTISGGSADRLGLLPAKDDLATFGDLGIAAEVWTVYGDESDATESLLLFPIERDCTSFLLIIPVDPEMLALDFRLVAPALLELDIPRRCPFDGVLATAGEGTANRIRASRSITAYFAFFSAIKCAWLIILMAY